MSQYVTTHNANGMAIFSQDVPAEPNHIPVQGDPTKGSVRMVYTIDHLTPDLSREDDIQAYKTYSKEGFPPGNIAPPDGASTNIITFGRDDSPWHRTMTLDVVYVIEGMVELHLDGGEVKTLKAGDTVVQRGTMHMWRNVTPADGLVRLLGITMPIKTPIEIGGKKLENEWRFS